MRGEERHRGDALREDDDAVVFRARIPAVGGALEQREEMLVARELFGRDGFHSGLERTQGSDVVLRGSAAFSIRLAIHYEAFQFFQPVCDGLGAGGRAREQRFFEARRKELLPAAARVVHGEMELRQEVVSAFFSRCRRHRFLRHAALGHAVLHLVAHVVLIAADEEAVDVVFRVVVRVGDGRRVEHVHERGEALRAPVVRRSREQDHRVAAIREQAREARALRRAATRRDILRLVDDDDVPIRVLEMRAVGDVVLQRIDGDDRLVVIKEWVVVRRELGADLADLCGVERDERDREAVPELFLKLRHHGFSRDDEDAFAFAAQDELAHEDAGFERLAKADNVGDEDAQAQLAERERRRRQLVRQGIHRCMVADVDGRVCRDALPPLAFEVEERPPVRGRRIDRQLHGGGIDGPRFVERREEDGAAVFHEKRHANAVQRRTAHRILLDLLDDPFLVAHEHAHARRVLDRLFLRFHASTSSCCVAFSICFFL